MDLIALNQIVGLVILVNKIMYGTDAIMGTSVQEKNADLLIQRIKIINFQQKIIRNHQTLIPCKDNTNSRINKYTHNDSHYHNFSPFHIHSHYHKNIKSDQINRKANAEASKLYI